MQQAIAYYRVFTARQGRSGLGMEAPRDAVSRFAAAEDFDLTAEFVEVETGKGANALDRRPQLAAVLATGRARKCPVGVVDERGLAGALNARGVHTARGRCWHVSNVKNVIDRATRQRLL